MLGINNYVIVTVVNALAGGKPTNFFDQASTTRVAAANSIYASMGNQHAKTDIQKQAYPYKLVKSVRAAYGITGTNFGTHVAYINGQRISPNATLVNGSEIVLIRNDLNPQEAQIAASRHQLLPSKNNRSVPKQLGEILPPLPRKIEIIYEINEQDPGPAGRFGPGEAGNVDGHGDFGGLEANP